MNIEALKMLVDHAGVYQDAFLPCPNIERTIKSYLKEMMNPEAGHVSLRGAHYMARYFDDGSLFISKLGLAGPEKKLYNAIMSGDVGAVQRMIMEVA